MATIKGDSYSNTLNGTSYADYIYGYGGNDTLNGYGGDDHLFGGYGSDHLNGNSGTDYLYGGAGNDYLDGGLGVDWLYGGDGNDTIYFGGYADHYDGGAGFDTLSFAKKTSGWTLGEIDSPDTHNIEDAGGSISGFEKVVGSPYADNLQIDVAVLNGGGGNDNLGMWGPNDGKIYGGAGNDHIFFTGQEGAGGLIGYGGSGNDTLSVHDMTGGSGNDTFVLEYSAPDDIFPGNDGAIVRDFTHGSDHILFSGEDPGKLLHQAGSDIWTVEAVDSSGNIYHDSIELVGITSLSSSEYSFG